MNKPPSRLSSQEMKYLDEQEALHLAAYVPLLRVLIKDPVYLGEALVTGAKTGLESRSSAVSSNTPCLPPSRNTNPLLPCSTRVWTSPRVSDKGSPPAARGNIVGNRFGYGSFPTGGGSSGFPSAGASVGITQNAVDGLMIPGGITGTPAVGVQQPSRSAMVLGHSGTPDFPLLAVFQMLFLFFCANPVAEHSEGSAYTDGDPGSLYNSSSNKFFSCGGGGPFSASSRGAIGGGAAPMGPLGAAPSPMEGFAPGGSSPSDSAQKPRFMNYTAGRIRGVTFEFALLKEGYALCQELLDLLVSGTPLWGGCAVAKLLKEPDSIVWHDLAEQLIFLVMSNVGYDEKALLQMCLANSAGGGGGGVDTQEEEEESPIHNRQFSSSPFNEGAFSPVRGSMSQPGPKSMANHEAERLRSWSEGKASGNSADGGGRSRTL